MCSKGAAIGAEAGVLGGAATGDVAKGVGYGGLAGAAAGTIYTLFTRGNDIVIPTGTSVEMVLQRPLILQQSQLAGNDETHGQARRWFPPANSNRCGSSESFAPSAARAATDAMQELTWKR